MNVAIPTLVLGSLYCLIALCLILQFRIMGYINIAVISYVVAAPYCVATLAGKNPLTLWFVACCVIVAAGISLVNWLINTFVLEPLHHVSTALKIFASTAIFALAITGINIAWPHSPEFLNNPLDKHFFTLWSHKIASIDLVTIVISVVLIAGLLFFLLRTLSGKKLRAYASDRTAARLSGISSRSAHIALSVVTGIFTMATGTLLAASPSASGNIAGVISYSLAAIAVVIIVQSRNVLACIISSFAIGFAQAYAAAHLSTFTRLLRRSISLFGFHSHIAVDQTFVTAFVPFVLALLVVAIVPPRKMKEDVHG